MPAGNLRPFFTDHVVIGLMQECANTGNRSPLWLAGLVQKMLGMGHNVVHDRACGTPTRSLQDHDETETSRWMTLYSPLRQFCWCVMAQTDWKS
jgi:hypothetical protein